MANSLSKKNHSETTSKVGVWRNRRLWGAVAITAILLLVVGYFLLAYQSIDEQLGAIDATCTLSNPENAATIYSELLAGNEQIPVTPSFLDESADAVVTRHTWTAREYPKLAEWIDHHHTTIVRLIEAAELDKCRFPIRGQHEATRHDRLWTMVAWSNLLVRAANNDVGEDRTDEALRKYRCIVQLGKHIRQQPLQLEYLCGTRIENEGIQRLIEFIVQADPNSTHLEAVQHLPLDVNNDWVSSSKDMIKVECLLLAHKQPVLTRLKYKIQGKSPGDMLQRFAHVYLEALAHRRALKIVVALKHYRTIRGHWPSTLDDVRALAPGEAFTDPINDDSFVYRSRGNVFELYSKGKNGIDEDGQYVAEIDPNSSDVIVQKDDIRFWPPSLY